MIKVVLSLIAVILSIVGYIPYYRDIFKRTTKPHAFSWLIWSVMLSIAFVAQFVEKGGAGAWVTGTTAALCLSVFFLALFKGEKRITLSDKLSLAGAAIALLVWFLTKDPLGAVLIIILIDIFAFFPTYRKSWWKPQEETAFLYALDSVKFAISLFALEQYNIVTYLYPAVIVLLDGSFVLFLLIRRKQLLQGGKNRGSSLLGKPRK